jgi:deoxyribodipyrimidine photo-lyase
LPAAGQPEQSGKKSPMIDLARVQPLNEHATRSGKFVLYWMQQSQRADYNHALEYAIERANELRLSVLAVFGLTEDYPEANLRHYAFMLEGLKEAQSALAQRGVMLAVQRGDPADVALRNSNEAALIVCDRGYLRHQKAWRRKVASEARCSVVQVESDVVVPVAVVSGKAEYAARTIRPKIQRNLPRFLQPIRHKRPRLSSTGLQVESLDLSDVDRVLDALALDRSVTAVPRFFCGGTTIAKARFERFVRSKLGHYEANRSQPGMDATSCMSPYLHFGQISPLYLALRIARRRDSNAAAFLDELIVRRELAMNFVEYTQAYDAYRALPQWARATLQKHGEDRRMHVYDRRRLEGGRTHDEYWNAAMKELAHTGYMHNHMRMYWGKKILEWSASPEVAHRTVLAIMNKYFLDGRDPNSYASVGWLFGLHDRPWLEREIFGTVRYMSAAGLERKANPAAYVAKVSNLVR